MKVKTIIDMILIFFLVASCDSKTKSDLQEREKVLVQKERKFAQKEAEYEALLNMRDSLRLTKSKLLTIDTIVQRWPDSISGQWNSRLVCRSSNCSSYVIGDQRNEHWVFFSDSTGLFVRATSHNKNIQLFKGTLQGNQIILSKFLNRDTEQMAKIQINLEMLGSKIIKGTQIIQTKADCVANFSVELTPNEK